MKGLGERPKAQDNFNKLLYVQKRIFPKWSLETDKRFVKCIRVTCVSSWRNNSVRGEQGKGHQAVNLLM